MDAETERILIQTDICNLLHVLRAVVDNPPPTPFMPGFHLAYVKAELMLLVMGKAGYEPSELLGGLYR